jgi:hypothetical protein
MPPTNHAARLREMAEIARQEADSYSQIARIGLTESAYKAIFTERREKYDADAAALLAGAEALEAIERAEKCLDSISVTAIQCFDRAAEVADLAEGVLDAMEGEKEKSDG